MKEYAYTEDKNFRFRPSMEDSKFQFLVMFQLTSLEIASTETLTAAYLVYSMAMEEDRWQTTAQREFPRNLEKR